MRRPGTAGNHGGVDIETAGDELYGVRLGEFTARRTSLARDATKAGDPELAKTIAGLRKPTTSAWLVNMLARHRAALLAEVTALGEELRDAQDALDADRLRELGRQRSALLRQAADEAAALAKELGQPASAPVRDEVTATLQTAMTDADAAAAVSTGTLVRPLSAEGWGIEEGGEVIAFPTATQRRALKQEAGLGKLDPRVARAPRKEARLDKLDQRKALEEAAAALADARREADGLRADADTLAQRRTRLRDEVQELARQLREAEAELADVEAEARGIRRSRDDAKRAVTAAERAVARARRRLE